MTKNPTADVAFQQDQIQIYRKNFTFLGLLLARLMISMLFILLNISIVAYRGCYSRTYEYLVNTERSFSYCIYSGAIKFEIQHKYEL